MLVSLLLAAHPFITHQNDDWKDNTKLNTMKPVLRFRGRIECYHDLQNKKIRLETLSLKVVCVLVSLQLAAHPFITHYDD